MAMRRNFASVLHHEMKKSAHMPAASERPLYRNAFDRADNAKLWALDKTRFEKRNSVESLSDLITPHAHGHKFANTGVTKYAHYVNVWEPVFPRTPDVAKGELISGANFTRTSGWHLPGEPAIVSVGKLAPDNQRAIGYAENAVVPDSITPDAFPDFREYRLPKGTDRRAAIYLMSATALFFFLALGRSIVCKVIHYFWIARDIAASGSVEVNVSQMLPGDQVTVKWRSKPVFIKRRTQDEIDRSRKDDEIVDSMRDPELDSDRNVNPEWLVNIGICTHLGCVPTKGGNYGGFFCPCHGSHYDASGRIRQGPAPANLEVPPYKFIDENTIKLG
ncbi:Cytochrome b-c1 complex subunit Rieske-1 [Babesia sp. Xinjiang]|uniref:Cytochrome b-c1 complex subunit Rieske-1 n=1 Tax=Babesia sp. Xinjiang TaxID=462227 RepID=UPI000A2668F1|nr:Cytochrome b-c1 complex subunit Rieske-1 [Babesia sp. Xinjiang]ORM40178.1 Cytochrome b-c1 complex subunit Rieske-1 [Babesia sp. Xinjiang]